ncbi:MAG: DUF2934 domain-containing protein [Rhodopila sp.]|nr:DUF2934 domain-containing protein [Rhodopila sp.]
MRWRGPGCDRSATARAARREVTVSDTKQDFEQRIRERAYFLWQQDGCPDGHADQHWERARDIEAAREGDDRRIDIEGEDSFPASDPPSHSRITGDAPRRRARS